MKKCIVIGAGLAGLTSAVYLSRYGYNVEILESSPKPGGRAYSFYDNTTGTIIDNGQHIMMGCYKETLRFFDIIGAGENLISQERIKVNFVKENFNIIPLEASTLPYPVNLLSALLNYRALSIKERLRFLKFFAKLPLIPEKDLKRLTVYEWLVNEKQDENTIKSFWEILAVGALNTNIKKASALTFAVILKEIFLRGNKAATIILPKYGLSETYCNNAVKYIEVNGGSISYPERVLKLQFNGDKIISVITDKRIISGFDFVISAVPLYSLTKFFHGFNENILQHFKYSSIVSIHVKVEENSLNEDFYGLINSPVHWVFNHKDHLSLVISDADEIAEKSKDEIFNIAAAELEKFLLIKRKNILTYKIIKEKRATFIPSPQILNARPGQTTQIKNLFLAGDWVDTGLPSTIESAVKSGRIATGLIAEN